MEKTCELFEPDGNGHLGPVGVNLERLVDYLRHEIVHLICSRMDINWNIGYQRLEDNFGLFPISVIAMASPFCDLRIRP